MAAQDVVHSQSRPNGQKISRRAPQSVHLHRRWAVRFLSSSGSAPVVAAFGISPHSQTTQAGSTGSKSSWESCTNSASIDAFPTGPRWSVKSPRGKSNVMTPEPVSPGFSTTNQTESLPEATQTPPRPHRPRHRSDRLLRICTRPGRRAHVRGLLCSRQYPCARHHRASAAVLAIVYDSSQRPHTFPAQKEPLPGHSMISATFSFSEPGCFSTIASDCR